METPAPPPTLLELLSSLVTAWRNLASYPPGHPARATALATAHGRLQAHLAHASPLVLGVARDALVSGDKKVETAHVRALARALYRRNGGVLRIDEGVEPRELETFLTMLSETGPSRDRPLTADILQAAGVHRIELAPIDYSAVVTTSDLDTPSGEDTSLWDGLMQTLLAGQPLVPGSGTGPGRERYSAESIASLFRGAPGEGDPEPGGAGGLGGPGSGGGRGAGDGDALHGEAGAATGSGTGPSGPRGGGRLGLAAAHTLARAIGARLAVADGDARETLAPQIIQLIRALPGEVREPVLLAALRVLATDEGTGHHLAAIAAALPATDVLRGLRRLAQEQGQLSGHALRMAQALAETHEEVPETSGLPEPPADFAAMAALFREEDVDRYNPEDHRALLAQKPTVDLSAIAVEVAADPEGFGPDTESDDAIERRLVTTLLDMTANSPEVVRPLALGRLREVYLRALQGNRFAGAIAMIRAIRELAADPALAALRGELDAFVERLADAPTLAALVAASRQPGGPPFVQVQTLVLVLGASATHGLLEALAAEPDRARRLRLIELAASLGPAIVPETRRLLGDPRWYVVRNMVLLLRRVHDKSAMGEILRCADHPDLRVRLEAIRALFAFDSAVPRDLLARTIHHPDPRLAEAAVLLTGQHGITQATDLLVQILSKWDFLGRRRSIRLKALRALADMADPAVLPRIARFFREWPFPLVALEERRVAYRLLASYDPAARAPYVARGERSRDSVIRDICRGLNRAAASS
ncbi:MAG TPA: HEAT repeat domain-containing protein [Methylomirabilota bacterium]|nr:HEAT repeat domain-containing protein [Methylomirabilota bacterium]